MQNRSISLALYMVLIGFILSAMQVQAQDTKAPDKVDSTAPSPSVIRFKDVSRLAGITFESAATEEDVLKDVPHPLVQAWGDFNNDGWLDLYLIREIGQPKLFVNNRDGTFAVSKLTEKLLPVEGRASANIQRGATWVDYNNDGWSDLYILVDGKNMLFENQWGHSFVEVAETVGLADSSRGSSAAWGDFNQDGYLDLFIANGACVDDQCLDAELGLSKTGKSAGGLVSSQPLRDKLYQSNGYTENGTIIFSDVSAYLSFKGRIGIGRDTSFVDFDEDGDLDIYVVNNAANNGGTNNRVAVTKADSDQRITTQPTTIVWRNDGPGCSGWCWSQDVLAAVELANRQQPASEAEQSIEAAHFPIDADLNNDGHIDPNPETWNINITNEPVFGMADYDQDGWLDIVAGYRGGQHRLFHNIGSASSESAWLNLRLIGDGYQVNRDAVGSQVTLTKSDGEILTRTSRVESKRGSSSTDTLHFGLGNSKISSLHILWPNGKETHLTEEVLIYQDTTFTWQIYYPVDVMGSIGGDVISAEETSEVLTSPTESSNNTESP